MNEIGKFLTRLESDESMTIRFKERRWQISHAGGDEFSIRWEECQFGVDGSLRYHQQTDLISRNHLIKILEEFSYDDLICYLSRENSFKSEEFQREELTQ